MSVRTLAVILARAGSKGLPQKNERLIAGRPCIEWTIDHALASRRIAGVVLSTDGGRLAAIGRRAGVRTIVREHHLAADDATIDDAARDALLRTEAATGMRYDAVTILYGNVPVRPDGLVDEAVDLLVRTGCDSVQSYAPVGKHHPCWTAVVSESGEVNPYAGEVLNSGIYRRQDLPPAHIPDGGVLVCSRRALMLELDGVGNGPHAFLGADRRGVIQPEGAVVDIDHEIDAIVAEAVLQRRATRGAVA